MQFLKYSVLFLSCLTTMSFTGTECFNSTFDVSVTHKSHPFGLLTKTLSVKKNKCEIEISHNQYKYHNRSWVIDVCRDPIHIKSTATSITVYRKTSPCDSLSSEFCDEYQTIRDLIEEHGLIFADGAKNSLSDDHGKVYCTNILLNTYLNNDHILHLNENYDHFLTDKKNGSRKNQTRNKTSNKKEDSDFVIEESAGPGKF